MKNYYNLRSLSDFKRPLTKSVYHGTEGIRGTNPKNERRPVLLTYLKIRIWSPENYPCRPCKPCISGERYYETRRGC